MKKTLLASLTAYSAAALAQTAPAAAQESPLGIGVWIAGIVLVGGAGVFVFRMLKQKDTPANPSTPQPTQRAAPVKPRTPAAPLAPARPPGVTGDFVTEGFLRQSKASFVRMQAAWDKADTDDLREFTTPEVFAELKTQVEARGQSTDVTEVVRIEAELLGIETVGERELASVKFVGTIKSSATAPAEPFSEIWNLARPRDGSAGWMLAGIQQLS